jgi:FMN phosphatase YigB (HAD superfamily)
MLIFDLDNTIYDWYSAFLPAFYAMVSIASDSLDCDREILLNELREVHIRHHDVEHPFSLVETKIVQRTIQDKGSDQVWALLDPAFYAFNRTRKANLKLFPGTLETLNVLSERGIQLVAYTDSTFYAAWGRVQRLGIAELFAKVYCRERGTSVLPNGRGETPPSPPEGKVVEIPSHESKPNPRVLLDIVTQHNLAISQIAYVGDSLAKDVLMAKRVGCFAIWAKYGAYTDRTMYERLIRISHWNKEDIEREKKYSLEAQSIQPDLTCEHSLEDLLSQITGPTGSLARGHISN